jgi:hypothetical protein
MTKHTTNASTNEIPYGYCHCGCGQKTKLRKKTKGKPNLYLKGHSTIRPDTPQEFWSRVDVRSTDECWEWQDFRDDHGYGRYVHKRKIVIASRRAWEFSNGPIPDGLFICHKCDNPSCCNPNHLYLGTPANNVADRVARLGKTPGADINAKLTVEQVKEIRERFAKGDVTKSILARDYSVTPGAIGLIINRKNWAHVP